MLKIIFQVLVMKAKSATEAMIARGVDVGYAAADASLLSKGESVHDMPLLVLGI